MMLPDVLRMSQKQLNHAGFEKQVVDVVSEEVKVINLGFIVFLGFCRFPRRRRVIPPGDI